MTPTLNSYPQRSNLGVGGGNVVPDSSEPVFTAEAWGTLQQTVGSDRSKNIRDNDLFVGLSKHNKRRADF